MFRISTTLTISLSLACLTISLLFAAQVLGFLPNETEMIMHGRGQISELIAVQCSTAVARSDRILLQSSVNTAVERNADLISARVVKSTGEMVAAAEPSALDLSRLDLVEIPIVSDNVQWGVVEMRFRPLALTGIRSWLTSRPIRLSSFVFSVCLIGFCWYLRRVLKHLDPSKVVPNRLRTTLDTLTEGLVVLDDDLQIVLSNEAFAKHVRSTVDDLQGKHMGDFDWIETDETCEMLPWERCV